MATLIAGRVVTILDADNKRLNDKLKESKKKISDVGTKSKDAGATISKSFKTAAIGGVALLGVALLKVGKDAIKAAADFETMKVAIDTMVGDTGRADTLISQIKELGSATPFTTEQLLDASKTLLAFGIETEKIQGTLKTLGDISSGTGKDIKEMAVIFGQVRSAGRLMGQDLLQLINAGFNPLQVISEKTGRSVRDLKDDMSKGLITFDKVEQAFKDATEEGGRFFRMMEKQSETFNGKLSTLQSEWKNLLEELGKSPNLGLKNVLDSAITTLREINSTIKEITDAQDRLRKGPEGRFGETDVNETDISPTLAVLRDSMKEIVDMYKLLPKFVRPEELEGIRKNLVDKFWDRFIENTTGRFEGLQAPTESEKFLEERRSRARKMSLEEQANLQDIRIMLDRGENRLGVREFGEQGFEINPNAFDFMQWDLDQRIDKSLNDFFKDVDKTFKEVQEKLDLEEFWNQMDFEDGLQRAIETAKELKVKVDAEKDDKFTNALAGAFKEGSVEAHRAIVQQDNSKDKEKELSDNAKQLVTLLQSLVLNGVKLDEVGLAEPTP